MNVQATCILIRKVTEKVWFELNGCNLFFKVKGGPIAPIVAERFDIVFATLLSMLVPIIE